MNNVLKNIFLAGILCISSDIPSLHASSDDLKPILFFGSIVLGTASFMQTAETFFTIRQIRTAKLEKANRQQKFGNRVLDAGRKSDVLNEIRKGLNDIYEKEKNGYRKEFSYTQIAPNALFSAACFSTATFLYLKNK